MRHTVRQNICCTCSRYHGHGRQEVFNITSGEVEMHALSSDGRVHVYYYKSRNMRWGYAFWGVGEAAFTTPELEMVLRHLLYLKPRRSFYETTPLESVPGNIIGIRYFEVSGKRCAVAVFENGASKGSTMAAYGAFTSLRFSA